MGLRGIGQIPGREETVVRDLVAKQPVFIDFTTASDSSGGEETKIEHALGRVPNGYAIIKQPPASSFTHGSDSDTTAWDKDFLYIEFDTDDVDLTIAVF